MRLFEFASDIDLGSIRTVLATYTRKANAQKADIKMPFAQFLSLIDSDDLPLGGPDSPKADILNALKNFDPTLSNVFDVDDNGYIIIKSETKPQVTTPKGGGPTVDKMASSAAQQSLNSKL